MKLGEEILRPVHAFLDGIWREDRILIVYHPDPDGVCAAVLFLKALKEPETIHVLNQGTCVTITDETLKRVKEKGYNKVIIVDLNVENDVESVRKLASLFNHLLIVDHHVSTGLLKREEGNITYINPCQLGFASGDKYPASKLSYDMLREWDKSMEKWDWIAAIGVVGDSADDFWADFIRDVCARRGVERNNIEMAARIIEFCRAKSYDLVEKALYILNVCNTLPDFLKSEVVKDVGDMEREYRKLTESVKRDYEDDEIVIIRIHTKYNMKSIVANSLSKNRFPHKTLVVIWEDETNYHLSLRRQDRRVDMNALAKNVIDRVKVGEGGGHVPAAGARIPKHSIHLEELKRVIIEEHNKLVSGGVILLP